MKKRYVIVFVLMLFCLTGCGDTQKLVCTATTEEGDIKSYSTLEIKIKENKVSNMEFIVDMEFPREYQNQLLMIANNIKNSKPYMDVSIVNGKIRLITQDDPDESFLGIKIDQEITYSELKEVLELQDYQCE